MLKKNTTKANRLLRKTWLVPIGVAALYFVVNLVLLLHHEPWRDEAQSWLIARDNSFAGMLQQLKQEGHPALWYILLYPLAHIGAPYLSLGIVSLVIMTAATFFLMRYAPFSMPVRLALLFSSAFIYYYPVISRNYSLVVLIIILICVFYKTRLQKPVIYSLLLSLLLQTHIWAYGFAGIAYVFFVYDLWRSGRMSKTPWKDSRLVVSVLLPIISLGLAALTLLLGGNSTGHPIKPLSPSDFFMSSVDFLTNAIQTPYVVTALGFIAMVILGFVLLVHYRRIGILFVASLSFPLLISVFIYGVILPRALLVAVFCIVCVWLAYYEQPVKNISSPVRPFTTLTAVLVALALLSIQPCLKDIAMDLKYPYSSGKDMGEYIATHLPANAVLVVPQSDYSVASIAPYTQAGQRFYSLSSDSFITYMNWQNKKAVDLSNMTEKIATIQSANQNVYMLILSDGDPTSPVALETGQLFTCKATGYDKGCLYESR